MIPTFWIMQLKDACMGCSAQSWTKYHIAVTQRKEAEPVVSKDYYDTHSPGVSPIPE